MRNTEMLTQMKPYNATINYYHLIMDTDITESNNDDGPMTLVASMLSCLMYAASASIFYKRSFNKMLLPVTASLLGLGLYVDCFNQPQGLNVIYLIFFMSQIIKENYKVFASRSLAISIIILFVFILDVKYSATTRWIPFWIRIFPTAVAQFIRKPLWLKVKLQQLRSKLGPLYILYLFCTVKDIVGDASYTVLPKCVAMLSLTAAVLAGFLLRPDNTSLLQYLKSGTTLAQRRRYHGRLMIFSLAGIILSMIL